MPIPAQPDDATVAAAVVALFRQLHDQIRSEIDGLTDDDLNRTPFPGANCIGTIVKHLLASEAESLQVAAGMPSRRDRAAEFGPHLANVTAVHTLLGDADQLLAETAPMLEPRLWQTEPLPTLPSNERRPSLTWLIGNYGHAREHVGQIQLTRDLLATTCDEPRGGPGEDGNHEIEP